jgi:hypothetical protein
MTEGESPDAPEGEFTDWILNNPIPKVVSRVTAIRAVAPSQAIRDLQTFALKRKIRDLNELETARDGAGNFDRLDATVVLALAALTRPVEDAAELAIGRWIKEAGIDPAQAPLTESIVHEITAQRTVPGVADFIRVCSLHYQGRVVEKALRAFIGIRSGRTDLDKALLYIALKDKQCDDDAATLLRLSLDGASRKVRETGADGATEISGIVGAVHHLSPSEKIVETWVDAEMDATREAQSTIELVADLLIGEPTGARPLAEHIGRGSNWKADSLSDLGKILIRRSPACFATVCEYMATRIDRRELAEIIARWCKSSELSGTLESLLAQIVASGHLRHDGSRDPRAIEFLEALDDTLRREPKRCRKLLRIAVAKHVAGRPGRDVAKLLGQVEGRRDLKRTAKVVNERLVDRLFRSEIPAADFVDYVSGLQVLKRSSSLTFWIAREFSDPRGPDRALKNTAATVGEVAARLCDKKLSLDEVAFDLLERFLENEQVVTAEAAATIVEQVQALNPQMRADPRWKSLFGATVGRWADAANREKVIAAFRDFRTEREAIIHLVQ